MTRAAFLLVALLAGCNQILGVGDFTTTDGAPGDANPSDCVPEAPDVVIGCATITHVRADGTTFETRRDMSRYIVAAYVRDDGSASGFEIISGTASADGVVRIEGITEGTPFYLRLHDPQDPLYNWPRYFYTTVHQLDLGYVQLGRDDTPATLNTPITLDITGLRPWEQGDALAADSFNAGTEIDFGFPDMPADGATAFTETVDWRNGRAESTFADTANQADRVPQLIDTTGGDDLWVLQYDTSTVNSATRHGFRVATVVAAGQAGDVTMVDGEPATIPVELDETIPATQQQFSMSFLAFRSQLRDGGRYAKEAVRCGRSANPGGSYGLAQGSFFLINANIWGGEVALNVNIPYSNPFPAAWDQVQWCSFEHLRYTIVPVENRQMSGYSYMTSYTSANDSYTWIPATRPPSNIRVGGTDGLAGGAVDFDGVRPVTINWDEVAGVNRYQIRVLGITEGFTAAFDTTETSVDMPADIFTQGNFYIFRVFAITTAADYAGGELYRVAVPMTVGRVSTGMFRFSENCGNNTPDAGEQCDTGGDSAACDDDCSLPVCGDGYVNFTANESCDEVVDAPLCDSDCTLPSCPDGHWNPTVEECDDGNATNGDGCAADCRLENCGDGTTQPPFEACDDNNRDSGDGCDGICQFE